VFYPLTTELSAWYARDFLAGATITIALVLYGFNVSLGEQKLIRSRVFTVLRENMNYSAPRLLEIFGVGRHSAKITKAEAPILAHHRRRSRNEFTVLAIRKRQRNSVTRTRAMDLLIAGTAFCRRLVAEIIAA